MTLSLFGILNNKFNNVFNFIFSCVKHILNNYSSVVYFTHMDIFVIEKPIFIVREEIK